MAINAATFAKLPYDPQKSFAPVSMVAIQPLLVAVHPSVPAKTMKELVALAKAKPGELAYGTAGSSIHLAVEQFAAVAGIKMNHIPYKGSAPAINDLVGGQIQVLFDPFSTLYPQVAAGKVRALGGDDREALVGRARPADARRSGLSRLRRQLVAGHRRAGRHAAADRRQAACDPGEDPGRARREGAVRQAGRRVGAEHARRNSATTSLAEITRWKKVAQDAGITPE